MAARRALIVEDDPDIRAVLTVALDSEGYEVQVARHGRDALLTLAEWQPQVILLDLTMPDMNGWEFRQHQLADPALADIPVVVMTAGFNLRAGVDALKATAILPKPFDLDALLALLSTISR